MQLNHLAPVEGICSYNNQFKAGPTNLVLNKKCWVQDTSHKIVLIHKAKRPTYGQASSNAINRRRNCDMKNELRTTPLR